MKEIVQGLVLGQLRYCLEIFIKSKAAKVKLQKIINSSARLVLKKPLTENVGRMLEELKWLNFHNFHQEQQIQALRRLLLTSSAQNTFLLLDFESRAYSTRRRSLKITWSPKTF